MVVYLISYGGSILLARTKHYYLSGAVLLLAALWLYIRDYRQTRNLIHLRGLFSLFWVGGQGLACMKLSHLQRDWTGKTWICFALAFLGFWIVFEVMSRLYGTGYDNHSRWRGFRGNPKPIFQAICCLTAVSVVAFVWEAVSLGYVPLFLRGVPHAYSEFHLTGVHYFTVSCVLVPALSVLYFHVERGRGSERRMLIAIGMTGISLLIPILCVSRFQFVFAVMLGTIIYISLQKQFRPVYLLGLLGILPVYLLLTVARSHDVGYLNGIFEMKYAKMPIFITQPYMYIANNYENFNCLVEVLPKHTFGMRSLFPLWALTGLKFLYPDKLINYPIYINKEELTTLTLFYDAYYDFGWIGVLAFSCLLGAAAYLLAVKLREMQSPMGYLLYAQMGSYLILSFFTTWFSNPATWFYLILTGLIGIYYHMNEHKRR
ncbi:MAG: oligosaccharide repeat unit polymerase [Lachnospiraceae bacterium]|nr:oligosaccharide repeat unit polymerase [Lachnospiraceae bacterium]